MTESFPTTLVAIAVVVIAVVIVIAVVFAYLSSRNPNYGYGGYCGWPGMMGGFGDYWMIVLSWICPFY